MKHAQLASHVNTELVTREALRMISAPEATATFQPIPHIELVEMLDQVLVQCEIRIRAEEFALRRDGAALFGVLELAYGDVPDGTAAMGLRTANNKTMSIQICAGLSVFVCDNLVFRGDLIALRRRHTSGLNLREELAGAVLRFQEHFGRLVAEIEALKQRELSDIEAKARIHDVFAQSLLPVRFLPAVSQSYFEPDLADFEPRTAWSLHNALTAAANGMPMSTRLPAIQALGKFFGMSNEPSRPVEEAA